MNKPRSLQAPHAPIFGYKLIWQEIQYWHWSKMWLNIDLCRSMWVNFDQFRSIKIYGNLCRFMHADSVMFWNFDTFLVNETCLPAFPTMIRSYKGLLVEMWVQMFLYESSTHISWRFISAFPIRLIIKHVISCWPFLNFRHTQTWLSLHDYQTKRLKEISLEHPLIEFLLHHRSVCWP